MSRSDTESNYMRNYMPNKMIIDLWARQQVEKDLEMSESEWLPVPGFHLPLKAQSLNKKKVSWPLPEEAPLTPPKEPDYVPKPPSTVPGGSPPSHKRNQGSYSLFPESSDLQVPAPTYAPNSKMWLPPKAAARSSSNYSDPVALSSFSSPPVTEIRAASLNAPVAPWLQTHHRNNSTESCATVQIGIRFSEAPSALAATGYRRNSLQAPKRPSMRAVLDSTSPPQSRRSLGHLSMLTQSRLSAPFDAQWDNTQPTHDERSRHSEATTVCDFTWFDSADATTSPKIFSRQTSQTRPAVTVESYLLEIEALQRSVSARSQHTSRPARNPEGRPAGGFF